VEKKRKKENQELIFSITGTILNFASETCAFIHHSKCQTDEAQAGIKIEERNINNSRYADDNTLMEESKEELNSLLMKVKEESEKASLKLDIQKLRSWNLVPSLHDK